MLEFCDDGHTFKFSHDQLPKHKIFISHSGTQKDFAEQLCEDLEQWGYLPFFDKRPHSLPKGENFPDLIFEATRECFLAIVLLSEEFFTRSKWPMLELASFVEAKKTREHLRILPVLLNGLGPDDLKDTARWSEVWETWVKQDNRLECNVVSEWEKAVKSLKPVNALLQSLHKGEVALRKAIVEAVTMSMPPDIHSDVAHVQGKERLKKEIVSKFSKIPPSCSGLCENAKVLGVHGTIGEGKSTLCMILTYFLRSEFRGRVCHVELGQMDTTIKLQCKALKQLTNANHDFLNRHIYTEREGLTCLKQRIPRQRVFLALDNVSDEISSVEAAKMFLKPKFHPGSMVLVTAHSRDVLHKKMGIPEDCCMPCPQITEREARQIMLDCMNLSIERLTAEQSDALRKTLDLCNFRDFRGFHPLCLKLLASQMGSDPSSWGPGDLHESSDKHHVLFSAIETNFSSLPNRLTQDIFMDVALFCPESVINVHDICMWLSDTLHPNCSIADINRKLHNLRLKSLMEVWNTDTDVIRIHDLHRELAKSKARVEEISSGNPSRFVYQRGANDFSAVLSNRHLAVHIERASFVECTFTKASFEECSQLQLLCIRNCTQLAALSLHGLCSLVSLELSCCQLKDLKLEGLVHLRWLCVNSCGELEELNASGLDNLMHVLVSRCINLEFLQLEKCNMLKSVCVEYSCNLTDVYLGSGKSLHCLTLWFCESLRCVHLSESMVLSEFRKRGCPQLPNIQGFTNVSDDVKCLILTLWHKIPGGVITSLEKSTHLQVLDLWDCVVSRLPDLRGCQNLHELRLSSLDVLLDSSDSSLLEEYTDILCASSGSLQLPVALQELRIESCRNVVVKEVCWKVQGLQNLRILAMQQVRVAWDWELYIPIEQKESNVTNQVEGREAKMDGEAYLCEEESSDSAESSDEAKLISLEISNCLWQIMYWVQEYLEHTAAAVESCLERQICTTIKLHMKKNMGKTLSRAASENVGLRWTVMHDHIQKSQYGIIERMLFEICNDCDTACEQVFQRLVVEDSGPSVLERVDTLVEVFQKVGAQELRESWLGVMRANNNQLQATYEMKVSHGWETWEEKVINEVAYYEKVRSFGKAEHAMRWEHRLAGEEIAFELPGVKTLTEKLSELTRCRGWESGTSAEQQNLKSGQSWLRSYKIEMLIEQLLVMVEKGEAKGVVDEDRGGPSHFQWLREMAEEVQLLMRNEMDKKWIEASGRHYKELDEFRSMLQGWKTCRWLQALASCLSQELVHKGQAVTDKRLWTTNHKFGVLFEAANVQLLHSQGFVTGAIWLFNTMLKEMVAILEALVLEVQDKQEMVDFRTWGMIKFRREILKRDAAVLQAESSYLQLLLPRQGASVSLSQEVCEVDQYMFEELIEKGHGFLQRGHGFILDLLDQFPTPLYEEKQSMLRELKKRGDGFLQDLSNLSPTPVEEVIAKERVHDEVGSMFGESEEEGDGSLQDLSNLSPTPVEEVTAKERVSVLDKWKNFAEGIEFITECNLQFRIFCLAPSADMAKMLREPLEFIQDTIKKFGDKSEEVVRMWERALRLLGALAEFLTFVVDIHGDQQEAEVKSKMVDTWERLSGMPYRQNEEYIKKVKQEVRQLRLSLLPKLNSDLLSTINEWERSALLKLMHHFSIIEDVSWGDIAFLRFGHLLNVDVQQIIERYGRMSALMAPYKPPVEISKEDDLHMYWRRAESSPLRQRWININKDGNFVLPITICSALHHLYISGCQLKLPINASSTTTQISGWH